MSRISYLNGKYVEHNSAMLHIDDRAIQFADSVYEVILFHKNRLIDGVEHWLRLSSSLAKLSMQMPYLATEFNEIAHKLFTLNNIETGSIYIQVTRGVSPRNQLIPKKISQTVIMTVIATTLPQLPDKINKAMIEPDIRWQMCDVKSTGLLIGSLYKQKAVDNGFDDVIMQRNNIITECCFSNLFIVKNNIILTHPTDNFILAGITRATLIKLAAQLSLTTKETKFEYNELINADEVFSTSTTTFVRPIHMIDDSVINHGKNGQITQKLFYAYHEYINK
jgi:D-alanine transaminase